MDGHSGERLVLGSWLPIFGLAPLQLLQALGGVNQSVGASFLCLCLSNTNLKKEEKVLTPSLSRKPKMLYPSSLQN